MYVSSLQLYQLYDERSNSGDLIIKSPLLSCLLKLNYGGGFLIKRNTFFRCELFGLSLKRTRLNKKSSKSLFPTCSGWYKTYHFVEIVDKSKTFHPSYTIFRRQT